MIPSHKPWVYPRTHGETLSAPERAPAVLGLSPHTRGNHIAQWALEPLTGSIPAHTGKPPGRLAARQPHRVYPRTHGETICIDWDRAVSEGLSPHTRGNQIATQAIGLYPGSIPAHTGKPSWLAVHPSCVWVYPRTHGETIHERITAVVPVGLSPHTRGNPLLLTFYPI